MNFIIQKENLLNNLRIVEHVTTVRGTQPVLSNILIETIDDKTLKLKGTDLDLGMEIKVEAKVLEKGSITLPAKKLSEIIAKLPENPINFSLNDETNQTSITCGNTKYDIIGIASTEFPANFDEEILKDSNNTVEVEIQPFLKAIRQTVFAAASYDTNNVLSGVYCNISGQNLEMAATDGNRLSRVIDKITNKDNKEIMAIIPSKTLTEFTKFVVGSIVDKVSITVKNGQILFKLKDRHFTSRLLDGQYPKYQQLIPAKSVNIAIVNRESFISALDRSSAMVNERTNIVKMIFEDNKLLLKADTPDLGDSMDLIDVVYDKEELKIAFNYKYIIDSLRIMESENVKIELGSSLSATLFKPDSEDDYLSLIMPVQIR
ncbi:MAG: DNA polymerase III subunit beta [Candidatus Gastranaerophilaceae bacterium]|jgi:DNA polymerase-3 subunit beta